MKKLILTSLLASAVLVNVSAQWSGTNPVSTTSRVSITSGGVTPDNGYTGSLTITQPAASGQYINLIRSGQYPWSIGTVYDGNNFAISEGKSVDRAFNYPFFVIAASSGNVGIGIKDPTAKLDVSGNARVLNELSVVGTGGSGIGGVVRIYNNSKSAAGQASNWSIYNMSGQYGNSLQFWAYDNIGCASGGMCGAKLTILDNGNVGIGTSTPDAPLTVKGLIHATQVKIDLSGALADYVFDKNYKLMDLKDVESYVNEHSHLPEVPSASEVATNGMDLGEMQNKMLQKIEELTLYVIKQQKEIEALKATSGK
jgi:Phage T4 tail fibre